MDPEVARQAFAARQLLTLSGKFLSESNGEVTRNRHLAIFALLLEVFESTLAVDARIFGHSQDALGNNVAHDFI